MKSQDYRSKRPTDRHSPPQEHTSCREPRQQPRRSGSAAEQAATVRAADQGEMQWGRGAPRSPEKPDGGEGGGSCWSRGPSPSLGPPEPPSSSGDAHGLRSGRTAGFSGRKKSFGGSSSRGCRPGQESRQNKAHVLTYQPTGKYLFRQEYLVQSSYKIHRSVKGGAYSMTLPVKRKANNK